MCGENRWNGSKKTGKNGAKRRNLTQINAMFVSNLVLPWAVQPVTTLSIEMGQEKQDTTIRFVFGENNIEILNK